MTATPMHIRNIAIIAHVDHGKTTLVDQLLRQSGTFRANQQVAERAMDSNDLERERGITILAKCTSVAWKGVRINIVDTPGHADFGGEVERILSMVDGVLVLVDAAEGPMPQTKFVPAKALRSACGRSSSSTRSTAPTRAPTEVHNEVFDLFAALDANEAQLDFPTLFASGRSRAGRSPISRTSARTWTPLFDLIVRHVPPADRRCRRALRHAGDDARVRSLSRPRADRPHPCRHRADQHAGQVPEPRTAASSSRRGSPSCSPSAASSGVPIEEAAPATSSPSPASSETTVADTICDPDRRARRSRPGRSIRRPSP